MQRAEHDQIVETVLTWIKAGKPAALATVVETWGSAPRPVGALLAISSDAEIQGSVSGGCVESAVVTEALDALEDGECRLLEYGISEDDAFAVGLDLGAVKRVRLRSEIGVAALALNDRILGRASKACDLLVDQIAPHIANITLDHLHPIFCHSGASV